MKFLRSIIILAVLAFMLAPAPASASNLTGKRFGYIMLGLRDYDNFNETSKSVEVGVNIPLGEVDIRPFFKHESLDAGLVEMSANTLAARGDYTIKRFQSFNMYVGAGAGLVFSEVDTIAGPVTTTEKSDDLLFQAHVGLDMSPAATIGLKPECAYQRTGDEDDVNCGLLFNLGLSNTFSLLAEGRFFFENRELFYAIGTGMKF